MAHLEVFGSLAADGSLLSKISHLVDDPPEKAYVEDGWTSQALIELVDADQVVLSRTPIPVRPLCAHPVHSDAQAPEPHGSVLAGRVPWIEDAALVRLIFAGKVRHEMHASASPPEVEVDWTPLDVGKGGVVELQWRARATDSEHLRYRLGWRPKGSALHPLVGWQESSTTSVDLEALPGGSIELVLQVTDGVHIVDSLSPTIERPLAPCQATILSPPDGTKHPIGTPLQLWGQGHYDDASEPKPTTALVWSSSLLGRLGEGTVLSVELSAGDHEITLTCGVDERRATTSVRILVYENAP